MTPQSQPQIVAKRKELQAKVDAHAGYLESAKVGGEYSPSKSSLGISSTEFAEKVRAQVAEIEDLQKQLSDLQEVYRAELEAKKLQRIKDGIDAAGSGGIHDDVKPGAGAGGNDAGAKGADAKAEFKSLGRMFVESKAFTGYARGSRVGPTATLDLTKSEIKALFRTTGDPVEGWDPQAIRTGIVSLYPTRPAPHVIDFIPEMPTSQNAVVYMEETTFTNAASEIAEADGTSDPDYGEAALRLTERSQPVVKVAVWLPVTDEQLEDIDQAEAYVDQRLMLMLRQRVDSQVLNGNGTAPNILGTQNVTGIQSRAKGNDSVPDALHKILTEIRADGFANPDVIFIHPRKWQDVTLLKTSDGQYIWGHPGMMGPKTLWGVPVVETTAITETVAVAGDYQTHAFFALKRGIDMQVTNSHGEYFTQGKQAIRMDMRGCMVHLRPKAFGEVTGL